jgi:MFS family permease
LGWLRAAPAIGSVMMLFVMAHLPPMKRAGPAMLWSVVGFGMATIVFGFSTSFWLSFAMLMLTGITDSISVVVRHTLVMLRTPNHMRGRVSAVNGVFINLSNELGEFESGLIAGWFGPVFAVVSGGVGTVVVVAWVAMCWPMLARLKKLEANPEH